jgi:hypothetical protein
MRPPQKRIEFIRRISSDHPEYGEDRIAPGIGDKVWHSPHLLNGTEIHGQKTPWTKGFSGMAQLIEEPGQSNVVV